MWCRGQHREYLCTPNNQLVLWIPGRLRALPVFLVHKSQDKITVMNNTDHHGDDNDNGLAFAAVSLCANTPQGQAPQWHELAAWRAGNLPEPRATEVLSHVANDPACFQQWLDIAEAESWAEEEALTDVNQSLTESVGVNQVSDAGTMTSPSTDRTRSITDTPSLMSKALDSLRSLFQQPLPVYGGAFAAVMLAVLLAPLLNTGNGLSLQEQLDRSMDTYIESGQGYLGTPPPPRSTRTLGGLFDDLSTSDVERLKFQFGMRQFDQQLQQSSAVQISANTEWQSWLTALPEDSIDCSTTADAAHCSSVAVDLQQLGQWSLMNVAACRTLTAHGQAAPSEDYWSAQYALYEQMSNLPSVTRSQVFGPLLPELSQPTPDALCNIVTSLVAAGQ